MATASITPDPIHLTAVKHGAYSHDLVLPNEDRDAYQLAGRSLAARYNPQTLEEIELVQTLNETGLRLNRAIVTERNLHTLTEQQQLKTIDELFGEQDEPARRALAQAAGLQANMRLFDQLSRHIARLQRTIDQTRRFLEFRISQRREAEQAANVEQLAELEKITEQSQPVPAHSTSTRPVMPHFTGSLKEFKRKQWLRQQEKRNQA